MIDGPLRDVLELVARRPELPPRYMALLLKQDPGELQVRLDVLTGLGFLNAERACCGRENRYSVTVHPCFEDDEVDEGELRSVRVVGAA